MYIGDNVLVSWLRKIIKQGVGIYRVEPKENPDQFWSRAG